MTDASKFQNIKTPYLTVEEQASEPATPDPGHQRLFIDSADGHLKRVDESDTVVDLEDTGAVSAFTDLSDAPASYTGHGEKLVAVKSDESGLEFVEPASSSGGGSGVPLDEPPGSPHAKDDEFDGVALDAKWTNPLSSGAGLDLTLSVANGWLTFEPATAGSSSTGKRGLWGIRQAAPAGSFSISAKVINPAGPNDDCTAGIYVARTVSTLMHTVGAYRSASTIPNIARAIASASYSESGDTGGFDGYNVDFSTAWGGLTWYKIVWDSGAGSISFYYSLTGVAWTLLGTRTGQSQPDRIGLAIYSNTGVVLANHALHCDWFRVTEP